jgi:acid-sensing ion channel, other
VKTIQKLALNIIVNDFYYSIRIATAIAEVCDSGMFNDIDPVNKTDCENCVPTLEALMGDADESFSYCKHIHLSRKCSELLKSFVTESGVCFVFNSLEIYRSSNGNNDDNFEEWTLDSGYRNYTGHIDIYPRAGSRSGFFVVFKVGDGMTDGICKGATQAFKIYLHLPNEAPQTAKHFYLSPFYHYTQIIINPRVTITDPVLRGFSVAKRQCYFSDERYLRFFRHYTQNNCEIECLVNLTLNRCGCLLFHMPSKF